jgi:hypothetical protein
MSKHVQVQVQLRPLWCRHVSKRQHRPLECRHVQGQLRPLWCRHLQEPVVGLVYTTETCAAPGRVCKSGVFLLLDVSILKGPELHLDVFTLVQETVLLLDLSTKQRPVLHLNVSAKQGSEMHLYISEQKELVLV